MDVLEKTLSNLIENQFPAYYREAGPVLVAFVKEYYKWLETEQTVANKIQTGYVTIQSSNNNVVGTSTYFTEQFKADDYIALYREDNSYDLYRVSDVISDTVLTISTNTKTAYTTASYANTFLQKNPLHFSRNYFEYKDIDDTTEEFLLFFKEKYLKNIQFETATNTRQLLKHTLDLYRSKGTSRSIDLLFRLVFGVGAETYYPSDDIMRLSDGKWVRPIYLEVSLNEVNDKLVGKQIIGLQSGALAFVEKAIRRTVTGKLIDVLYISAVKGNFITGESINSIDKVLESSDRPSIIGSLTNVDIDLNGTGYGYAVGDRVDISSTFGRQAKGKVTNISNIVGLVNFNIVNGGYAYSNNAQVLVSEKVLTLSNVNIGTVTDNYFDMLETVTQAHANINYVSANGPFAVNDSIYTYHANNVIKGTGRIVQLTNSSSTNGEMHLVIYSGNLNSTAIYTTANAVAANLAVSNGFIDRTSTSRVMGISSNVITNVINISGSYVNGERVYQKDSFNNETANGYFKNVRTSIGANATIEITNTKGVFLKDELVYGVSSGATSNLQSISLNIGVVDISNTLTNVSDFYIVANTTGTNAVVTTISVGDGATFMVSSNNYVYKEYMNLNSDFISSYTGVNINAASYGLPGNISGANVSTVLASALTYSNTLIGKINSLTSINRGSEYSIAPFILVYEPLTYIYRKKDHIIQYSNTVGEFSTGELIYQVDTGARGIVKEGSNSTHLLVERLNLNDNINFVYTTGDNGTLIEGERSSATAYVKYVYEDDTSKYVGYNASIESFVRSEVGAMLGLEITDSGFGYNQNEIVTIFNNDNPINDGNGTGIARLNKQGVGTGYYRQHGGFLSNSKKMFDGRYYQEYSYDIRSSITLNKYEEMLKNILHVAGTQYFASFVYSNVSIKKQAQYESNVGSMKRA
jgi:hypothetical protein